MSELDINYQALAIIFFVYSFYSWFFSLFICYFFWKYSFLRTVPGNLICTMFIMESLSYTTFIITSLFYIVDEHSLNDKRPNCCIVLGLILSFSDMMKNFVILFISIFCYMDLCLSINPAKISKYVYVFIVVLSIVLAFIPFYDLGNIDYGASDKIQCWFTNDNTSLLAFYTPLMIFFIFSMIMMYLCHKKREGLLIMIFATYGNCFFSLLLC